MSGESNNSLDVLGVGKFTEGIGKIMEAIPDEAYIRTVDVSLDIIQKTVSPILLLAEPFQGISRYVKQKFDNMVEVEKSLLSYSLEKAFFRAEQKANTLGIRLHEPKHIKSFVTAIEQVAKETEPTLHEMWVNLIANDISKIDSHPNFVNTLNSLSSEDAQLLQNLTFEKKEYRLFEVDRDPTLYDTTPFFFSLEDKEEKPWSIHCENLCNLQLAQNNYIGEKPPLKRTLILTKKGNDFLTAVSP